MLSAARNSGFIPAREHLAQCESVRGLAILLVFAFHFLGDVYGYEKHPGASYVSSFVFGGDTGVTLFFVLSGFLLTLPFFNGAPLKLGEYMRNRALRIVPMYYLMVLLAGWWTGQWWLVPKALTFQELKISELFPMGAVWWSLVVEAQFYLLLPCIVLLAQRKLGRWLVLLLLVAGIYIYWRISLVPMEQLNQPDSWASYRNTLLGRWPLFAVGAILAWVHVWLGPRLQTSQLASQRWPGALVLLCALLLLAVILHRRVAYLGAFPAHALWFNHYVLEAIGWGLFLFALFHLRPFGGSLLVNPIFHRVGLWSYSLYLVHTSVLLMVGGRIARKLGPLSDNPQLLVAVGVGLLAISCALSAATYHLVEQPFLNLKRRCWRTAISPVQG